MPAWNKIIGTYNPIKIKNWKNLEKNRKKLKKIKKI